MAGSIIQESLRQEATPTKPGNPNKLSPNQKCNERAKRAKEKATEAATVLTLIASKEGVLNPGKEASVAEGQKKPEVIVDATKTKRGKASNNNKGTVLMKEGSKFLPGIVETQDRAEGRMVESPKPQKIGYPKKHDKSGSVGKESNASDGTSKA